MKAFRLLVSSACVLALMSGAVLAENQASRAGGDAFLVKPYLQVGYAPQKGALRLLWQTPDSDTEWAVEYESGNDAAWTKAQAPTFRRIAVEGIEPYRIYSASLTGLKLGGLFHYRVLRAGESIFSTEAHAPKSSDQPYRFAVFGDCGAGTEEQKPIAYRAALAKPDLIVVPGDIVYEEGRISEYRQFFWPVYNADDVSLQSGGPLLRSIPLIASPGNHDTGSQDLVKFPDGMAYFYHWEFPLNGPLGRQGGAFVPSLKSSETSRRAFADGAGEAYPRMTNFSYDYGNAHWTIVDSNPYVDWTDKELREWVERDLAAAQSAKWRFVAFHHPGFNSAREHFEQQHMRLLAPIFEAGKVDIVFSGHVHNYQRSYPLRFTPDKSSTLLVGKDGKTPRGRVVNGIWKLDKSFDGKTDTTPNGVLYIVTGAGGQHLYNPEQQDDRDSWLGFTHKFISQVHSLTVADVDGSTLTVRQVTGDGQEVDRFIVTK